MGTIDVTTFPDRIALHVDPRIASHPELRRRESEAERFLTALKWKTALPEDYPVIVSFMGGTGTGKSTLFNSIVGSPISPVGICRPCTTDPVLYLNRIWREHTLGQGLFGVAPDTGQSGREVTVRIVEHDDPALSGMVLVDAPDLDSVRLSNRDTAELLFIVSDMLILVTSQEKYGDLTALDLREWARRWGKRSLFVMNKVASDAAFGDFEAMLASQGDSGERVVRVERADFAADIIPGLIQLPEFSELLAIAGGDPSGRRLRSDELERLRRETLARVEDLIEVLETESSRTSRIRDRIGEILSRVDREMEARLDGVISEDVRSRIQDRLAHLLKKYDIFSGPRSWVRNTIRSIVGGLGEIISFRLGGAKGRGSLGPDHREDLQRTRSNVDLEALHWAVALLNREIADLLASDPDLDDLRAIAKEEIPRWGPEEIRARFDEAFPGVERLLEAEFDRIRQGLSRSDEIKLYGSYTLWALVLITAEIVLGGGFSLLDALLGGAVLPFIPKWLLGLKVLDLLREIGTRVNDEYHRILRTILTEQAQLYIGRFEDLLPGGKDLEDLQSLRDRLRG